MTGLINWWDSWLSDYYSSTVATGLINIWESWLSQSFLYCDSRVNQLTRFLAVFIITRVLCWWQGWSDNEIPSFVYYYSWPVMTGLTSWWDAWRSLLGLRPVALGFVASAWLWLVDEQNALKRWGRQEGKERKRKTEMGGHDRNERRREEGGKE
jgi:hypothetical protein